MLQRDLSPCGRARTWRPATVESGCARLVVARFGYVARLCRLTALQPGVFPRGQSLGIADAPENPAAMSCGRVSAVDAAMGRPSFPNEVVDADMAGASSDLCRNRLGRAHH